MAGKKFDITDYSNHFYLVLVVLLGIAIQLMISQVETQVGQCKNEKVQWAVKVLSTGSIMLYTAAAVFLLTSGLCEGPIIGEDLFSKQGGWINVTVLYSLIFMIMGIAIATAASLILFYQDDCPNLKVGYLYGILGIGLFLIAGGITIITVKQAMLIQIGKKVKTDTSYSLSDSGIQMTAAPSTSTSSLARNFAKDAAMKFSF